jgi:hypothetical protein
MVLKNLFSGWKDIFRAFAGMAMSATALHTTKPAVEAIIGLIFLVAQCLLKKKMRPMDKLAASASC